MFDYKAPEMSNRQKERLIVLLVNSLRDKVWLIGESIFAGGNPKKPIENDLYYLIHKEDPPDWDTVGNNIRNAMIYLYFSKEEDNNRAIEHLNFALDEVTFGHRLRYGDQDYFNELVSLAMKEEPK